MRIIEYFVLIFPNLWKSYLIIHIYHLIAAIWGMNHSHGGGVHLRACVLKCLHGNNRFIKKWAQGGGGWVVVWLGVCGTTARGETCPAQNDKKLRHAQVRRGHNSPIKYQPFQTLQVRFKSQSIPISHSQRMEHKHLLRMTSWHWIQIPSISHV